MWFLCGRLGGALDWLGGALKRPGGGPQTPGSRRQLGRRKTTKLVILIRGHPRRERLSGGQSPGPSVLIHQNFLYFLLFSFLLWVLSPSTDLTEGVQGDFIGFHGNVPCSVPVDAGSR